MRHGRSAITLLEITIVMLVIGMMAAIAAPRFASAVQTTQSRSAAMQIAANVDYVRRVAINEGRTTTFQCDPTTDRYQSTDVEFPNRIGQWLAVDVKEMFDSGLELTCDFDGASTIAFDLEGVPHVGNQWMQSGMITVSSSAATYHVVIASGTGATTVLSAAELDGQSGASGVGP